jgi:hypothetical protein
MVTGKLLRFGNHLLTGTSTYTVSTTAKSFGVSVQLFHIYPNYM